MFSALRDAAEVGGLVGPVGDEAGDVVARFSTMSGWLLERLQRVRLVVLGAHREDDAAAGERPGVVLEGDEASPLGCPGRGRCRLSPSSPITPPHSVLSRSSTRHLPRARRRGQQAGGLLAIQRGGGGADFLLGEVPVGGLVPGLEPVLRRRRLQREQVDAGFGGHVAQRRVQAGMRVAGAPGRRCSLLPSNGRCSGRRSAAGSGRGRRRAPGARPGACGPGRRVQRGLRAGSIPAASAPASRWCASSASSSAVGRKSARPASGSDRVCRYWPNSPSQAVTCRPRRRAATRMAGRRWVSVAEPRTARRMGGAGRFGGGAGTARWTAASRALTWRKERSVAARRVASPRPRRGLAGGRGGGRGSRAGVGGGEGGAWRSRSATAANAFLSSRSTARRLPSICAAPTTRARSRGHPATGADGTGLRRRGLSWWNECFGM